MAADLPLKLSMRSKMSLSLERRGGGFFSFRIGVNLGCFTLGALSWDNCIEVCLIQEMLSPTENRQAKTHLSSLHYRKQKGSTEKQTTTPTAPIFSVGGLPPARRSTQLRQSMQLQDIEIGIQVCPLCFNDLTFLQIWSSTSQSDA